jgi:hypothetical protein
MLRTNTYLQTTNFYYVKKEPSIDFTENLSVKYLNLPFYLDNHHIK